MPSDWQSAIDAVWAGADELGDAEVIRRIDALAAELPEGDPRGPFEAGGARDSAGLEVEAEAYYRRSLALGLSGRPRVEALIQLASTVRVLGRPGEALGLLDQVGADAGDLADAVTGFRALALIDAGDPRRGASEALEALSAHLPQYRRSLAAYARGLRGGAASA